jgi:hypothetical protein
MSFSNYLEDKLLDHVLKIAAYTVPTNIYVALSTADPGEAGATIAEPVGNGYVRKVCNAWTQTAQGVRKNTAEILFDLATASWGNVTHFALFDAITDGNLLGSGALTAPNTIDVGETPRFPAQTLQMDLD